MEYGVIVVGGGPAGSAAAIKYLDNRETDEPILIMERSYMPRQKPCGGGLSQRAITLLWENGIGIDDVVEQWITGFHIEIDDEIIEYHSKKTLGATISREKFDYKLIQYAKQLGARVIFGDTIKQLEPGALHFKIKTKRGDEHASHFIVAADGFPSHTSVLIGNNLFDPKTTGIAIVGEFSIDFDINDISPSTLYLFFNKIPYGYGWLFPKNDKINIGIGGQMASLTDPIAVFNTFKHYLEKKYKFNLPKAKIQGHLIPGKIIKRPVMGTLLFVGDAAGLVDPFSGEGISYALESGFFAGEIISKAMQYPLIPEFYDQLLQEYTQYIKKEIAPDFRIAYKITKLMQRRRFRRIIIRKLKEHPEILDTLSTEKRPYTYLAQRNVFIRFLKYLPFF